MAAWLPYLVAIAATLAAGPVARHPVAMAAAAIFPYLTFFGAVMVAAWYGGLRPGLLATALSAAITSAFFLAPTHRGRWSQAGARRRPLDFRRDGLADQRRRRGAAPQPVRASARSGAPAHDAAVDRRRRDRDRRAPAASCRSTPVAERLTGWSTPRTPPAGRSTRSSGSSTRTRASRSTTRRCGRCATARSSAWPITRSCIGARRHGGADRRQRRPGPRRRRHRRRQRAGVSRRVRPAPHRADAAGQRRGAERLLRERQRRPALDRPRRADPARQPHRAGDARLRRATSTSDSRRHRLPRRSRRRRRDARAHGRGETLRNYPATAALPRRIDPARADQLERALGARAGSPTAAASCST